MPLNLDTRRDIYEGDPDADDVQLSDVGLSRRAYDALMELCRMKSMPVQLMVELLLCNSIEAACKAAKTDGMKSDPIRIKNTTY